MNKIQKWILIGVIVVIVVMFFFPPFYGSITDGRTVNCGYHFILSDIRCRINEPTLLTQWVGVLIVGWIAYFIAKGSK